MEIPRDSAKLLGFMQELTSWCSISMDRRRNLAQTYKNYYLTGTRTGRKAIYNRIGTHIERLTSYLFSPRDVQFAIEYTGREAKIDADTAQAAAEVLSDEVHATGVDEEFQDAVRCGLQFGGAIIKAKWTGEIGADVILAHNMGVLREDLNSLDDQECIYQRSYVHIDTLMRQLRDHPKRAELKARLEAGAMAAAPQDAEESYFHQVVMSGTQPLGVNTPTGATGASPVFGQNVATLAPEVATRLAEVHELWVMDNDRNDWTTLIYASPDIIIEGELVHRNLMRGGENGQQDPLALQMHPYQLVVPNKLKGYLWGLSEIHNLDTLQNMFGKRIRDIKRILDQQADPPRAFSGATGITAERMATLNRPRGFIAEDNPNFKVETLAPELPQGAFGEVREMIGFFDDISGFAPILSGQGEPGVRAEGHAAVLMKTATPRLRDRALVVEKQFASFGGKLFVLQQMKDANKYQVKDEDGNPVEGREGFLLRDLLNHYRLTVDSHSSSPLFRDEMVQETGILARLGAVGPEDALDLINPPRKASIMRRLKARQRAEAQLALQNPDGAKKRGRR